MRPVWPSRGRRAVAAGLILLLLGGLPAPAPCGTLVKTPVVTGVAGPRCPPSHEQRPPCNTCAMPDGYVLALTWQPAFCEIDGADKPECRLDDPSANAARQLSLHGLWPNRRGCGIRYEFCGDVRRPATRFRDYPPVSLAPDTRRELERMMPSAAAQSGLERHEWHKHGTCTGYGPDAYFQLATDLARQFNQAGMAQFMTRNSGREVSVGALLDAVDQAFGRGARDRIVLECNRTGDLLLEVRVSLPGELRPGVPLAALIQEAPPAGGIRNCRRHFTIDAVGE